MNPLLSDSAVKWRDLGILKSVWPEAVHVSEESVIRVGVYTALDIYICVVLVFLSENPGGIMKLFFWSIVSEYVVRSVNFTKLLVFFSLWGEKYKTNRVKSIQKYPVSTCKEGTQNTYLILFFQHQFSPSSPIQHHVIPSTSELWGDFSNPTYKISK